MDKATSRDYRKLLILHKNSHERSIARTRWSHQTTFAKLNASVIFYCNTVINIFSSEKVALWIPKRWSFYPIMPVCKLLGLLQSFDD